MFPIFEREQSIDKGHSYKSFIKRFREICQNHYDNKRAKAFAFLFYDTNDLIINDILQSKGGFDELDKLSGQELTIFYLNNVKKKLNSSFNKLFLETFEVEERTRLPLVLFLKFDSAIDEILELQVVFLEERNYILSFHELYKSIDEYINRQKSNQILQSSLINESILLLFKKGAKLSLDAFIAFILEKYLSEIFK